MKNKSIGKFAAYILIVIFCSPVFAQEDMPGSQDHPKIPRIQGTVISGYAYSDYDEGVFITEFKDRNLERTTVGGKRTRILYLAPKTTSGPLVWKNYTVALKTLGEIENIYSCVADTCASNLGRAFVWSKSRRIPNNINSSDFLYATFGYRDQRYEYMTVTNGQTRYHVSLYYAWLTGFQAPDVKDTPAIHLEIIEEADFKATLQVVTPDEIASSISEKGRIALYGIHFDFDSDVLRPDSTPALESIATALNRDPALKIYVVGHTDNQGGYDYNLELSTRRAASVVEALTKSHGISAGKLLSAGVGPVAPVASNRTKEGQALNRRVELVEF